jgi:hypothetical protein
MASPIQSSPGDEQGWSIPGGFDHSISEHSTRRPRAPCHHQACQACPCGPLRRRMKKLPDRAQLCILADQRRLQPVHPLRAAHAASTRAAFHSATGPDLPFSRCSPASSNPIAPPASRRVAASTSAARAQQRPARGRRYSPRHQPPCLTNRAQGYRHLARHHPRPRRRPRCTTSSPSWPAAATRSSAARTARSASASVAAGVPHTAMIASPMNFSTTPAYRPTTVRAILKNSERSSRAACGRAKR